MGPGQPGPSQAITVLHTRLALSMLRGLEGQAHIKQSRFCGRCRRAFWSMVSLVPAKLSQCFVHAWPSNSARSQGPSVHQAFQ